MAKENAPLAFQNLMCIVYYDEKLPTYYRDKLEARLNTIFIYVQTFHNVLDFAVYIRDAFIVNNVVFIISGPQAKFLCDIVQKRTKNPEKPFMYEVQFLNKPLQSTLHGDKRFQCLDRLFEKIHADITGEQITHQTRCDKSTKNDDDDETVLMNFTIPFGIHDCTKQQHSFHYLNGRRAKFMLFQSLVDVLLGIQISQEDVEKIWISCRQDPSKREKHLDEIDQFQRDYNPENAIQFYTQDAFLFRKINKAFRCEHYKEICMLRPLLKHICEQLTCLLEEQKRDQDFPPKVLYRGKKLTKAVLQQLEDNQNKLISINGLLSTTKRTIVAEAFADTLNQRPDYETVVFEMHLNMAEQCDTLTRKRPYADISKQACNPDEEEVLFFVGFVWRIKTVDKCSENNWKVVLELSDEADLKSESRECSYFSLGKILHNLGEFTEAITSYKLMLESSTELPKQIQGDIYYHQGISKFMLGNYDSAYECFNKAEELIKEASILSKGVQDPFQLIVADDSALSPMSISTNKGLMHQKMSDIKNARVQFTEALEKQGSMISKVNLYYYLGVLEFECGDYETAHNYFKEAKRLNNNETLTVKIEEQLRLMAERIAHKASMRKNSA